MTKEIQFVKNVDLSKLNTLRVEANAKDFVVPKTNQEVIELFEYLKKQKLDWHILGAGSNTLLSSRDIPGVVISTNNLHQLTDVASYQDGKTKIYEVGAGMRMPRFCGKMSIASMAGAEFMEGIPGSIGGGIVMNAGAHKWEIADILLAALVLDIESLEAKLWINKNKIEKLEENKLSTYFKDLFKYFKNNYDAQLYPELFSSLDKLNNKSEISKEDLYANFEQLELEYRFSNFDFQNDFLLSGFFEMQHDSKEEIRKRVLQNNRARTLNQPVKAWTCGCSFQNPGAGVGAGKLIDELGLKGYRIGDFKISMQHGNFFENTGKGNSMDFCKLLFHVKEVALQERNIQLQLEVKKMGFFTEEEAQLWNKA